MIQPLVKSMTIDRSMESKHRKPIIVFLSAVLLQFVWVTDLLAYKMYRYKDKNGKTVVTSTLPPEVSQNGYEILNDMLIVVETVAPRKTAEQLRQEKIEAQKLEAERQRQLEQQRLDTILINSYTDISDIERARDIELESKDRDVMLLKQNIRRYTRLLEAAQTRAARDERLGKELSPSLLKEIKQYQRRIAKEQEEVTETEESKDIINDRYNSSIIRFSELKAAERLRRFQQSRDGEMNQHTIFQCNGKAECDNAWSMALRFASEYSTTDLEWANELTIMMRKPQKDDDLSLVMTRVNNSGGDSASIVLEVRCAKTQAGEDFCESEQVTGVKNRFSSYFNPAPINRP